jgi:hypothetical protein
MEAKLLLFSFGKNAKIAPIGLAFEPLSKIQ